MMLEERVTRTVNRLVGVKRLLALEGLEGAAEERRGELDYQP